MDLSSWMVRDHLLDGVFRFGSPAPDLRLYSDASRSGWGAHLLDRVQGVIGAREVVSHPSILQCRRCFGISLISGGGHRSSCDRDVR